MDKEKLLNLLSKYIPSNEIEKEFKKEIIDFVSLNDIFLGKGNPNGHIIASTWILNKDKTKVLLTHHQKLNAWVQLGGHTEVGEDVLIGALREAYEESGLTSITAISKDIFDIAVHNIPEFKNEKEHVHYGIRFLCEADENEKILVSNESKDVKWVNLCEIEDVTKETGIMRMVEKTNKYLRN